MKKEDPTRNDALEDYCPSTAEVNDRKAKGMWGYGYAATVKSMLPLRNTVELTLTTNPANKGIGQSFTYELQGGPGIQATINLKEIKTIDISYQNGAIPF
jgi:hypothetical protein